MRKLITYTISIAVLVPHVAFGAGTPTNFKGLVGVFTDLIKTLIFLIFALTFIVFMWGIIKAWIVKGGDVEGVESGKKVVLVGVIVLVIMSSIWGILQLLKASLFG